MSSDRSLTSSLLARACAGDGVAMSNLSPVLYEQLRGIARKLLAAERPGHTLQPTALVHEAYLKLVDESQLAGRDAEARHRFLGVAANAMRRILVDHARSRIAAKRGGGRERVVLDDVAVALPLDADTLIDLDTALGRLDTINPVLGKIAELRLFGGLTVSEVAPVMQMSLTTAKEHWSLTRAWLSRLLGPAA